MMPKQFVTRRDIYLHAYRTTQQCQRMPSPRIEFEVDTRMALGVRNAALDFTDRWRGFEADVFRLINKLTATSWRLSKIKIRFQSTATLEPETHESRATIQLNATEAWTMRDYLRALMRELILFNTREKVRRHLTSPLDEAVYRMLADLYASRLQSQLQHDSILDFRPSIAHFLSVSLPTEYPQANRERLLAESSHVRSALEPIMSEFPLDSGRFYDAFVQAREQLSEKFSHVLTANL